MFVCSLMAEQYVRDWRSCAHRRGSSTDRPDLSLSTENSKLRVSANHYTTVPPRIDLFWHSVRPLKMWFPAPEVRHSFGVIAVQLQVICQNVSTEHFLSPVSWGRWGRLSTLSDCCHCCPTHFTTFDDASLYGRVQWRWIPHREPFKKSAQG